MSGIFYDEVMAITRKIVILSSACIILLLALAILYENKIQILQNIPVLNVKGHLVHSKDTPPGNEIPPPIEVSLNVEYKKKWLLEDEVSGILTVDETDYAIINAIESGRNMICILEVQDDHYDYVDIAGQLVFSEDLQSFAIYMDNSVFIGPAEDLGAAEGHFRHLFQPEQ